MLHRFSMICLKVDRAFDSDRDICHLQYPEEKYALAFVQCVCVCINTRVWLSASMVIPPG